jgi:sulfate adenylyltransferase
MCHELFEEQVQKTPDAYELIGYGAFSPLGGFMSEADYVLTRDQMRLVNGSVWTIPVTLSATEEERAKLKVGDDVALRAGDGRLLAVLHLAEIFKYDKQLEAERVYLTTEEKHPGVNALYAQGDYLLGGQVSVVERRHEFAPYRYSPSELRALFAERGWRSVVAFQTRNPVHRVHEYIC